MFSEDQLYQHLQDEALPPPNPFRTILGWDDWIEHFYAQSHSQVYLSGRVT